MDFASCLVIVSLILVGQDSYDLVRPMLLNYAENIELIGGSDRTFFIGHDYRLASRELEQCGPDQYIYCRRH